MNKIFCDVCGTSYPETEAQCPICGMAKTDASKSATGETGYAYVKGGRFSHANVRKRNAGKNELPRVVAPVKPTRENPSKPRQAPAPKPQKQSPPPTEKKEAPQRKRPVAPEKRNPPREKDSRATNIVLAIIALVLVVLIVLMVIWLAKDWWDGLKPTEPSGNPSTTQGTVSTSAEIPCTALRLALSEKNFTSLGDKFQLSVLVEPADTTDALRFESADENIATVDEKGIVYPVANGTTTIYVYCGSYTVECTIICDVGVDPTQPTEPNATTQPTEPTGPVAELKLNRTEFTLNGYGDSHIVYSGELDRTQITWSTSDETVATVTDGKVVAVGNGTATITAEYMGQKATCIVRCTNVVVSKYELRTMYGSGNAFTLSVGDTITLYVVDKETGMRIQAVNLAFSLSKDGVVSIDSNGKITALKAGSVTISVTYGDVTLKSKVHIKN